MPNYLTEGNRAWEAILTAHAKLMRELAAEPVWREHDASMRITTCSTPSRNARTEHRRASASCERACC